MTYSVSKLLNFKSNLDRKFWDKRVAGILLNSQWFINSESILPFTLLRSRKSVRFNFLSVSLSSNNIEKIIYYPPQNEIF